LFENLEFSSKWLKNMQVAGPPLSRKADDSEAQHALKLFVTKAQQQNGGRVLQLNSVLLDEKEFDQCFAIVRPRE
jgi:hypothetical protein